jgi:bacterioferritin-associated ferredoxin
VSVEEADMFVCACHGYNEASVERAIDGGPESLAEVYRRLGERPRCGKCVPDVLKRFQDRCGAASAQADAAFCCSAPVATA